MSPYIALKGEKPAWVQQHGTFGKVGIVLVYGNNQINYMLQNCGTSCLLIYYAENHSDIGHIVIFSSRHPQIAPGGPILLCGFGSTL